MLGLKPVGRALAKEGQTQDRKREAGIRSASSSLFRRFPLLLGGSPTHSWRLAFHPPPLLESQRPSHKKSGPGKDRFEGVLLKEFLWLWKEPVTSGGRMGCVMSVQPYAVLFCGDKLDSGRKTNITTMLPLSVRSPLIQPPFLVTDVRVKLPPGRCVTGNFRSAGYAALTSDSLPSPVVLTCDFSSCRTYRTMVIGELLSATLGQHIFLKQFHLGTPSVELNIALTDRS